MKSQITFYSAVYILLFSLNCVAANPPPIQLAKTYRDTIQVTDYFVSEKYDGIRGYWDGEKMLSKQGNLLHLPSWFTEHFPQYPLDGELWLGRGTFEQISSLVRSHDKSKKQWKNVRFMVFDLPSHPGRFHQRVIEMKNLATDSPCPYLQVVEQFEVQSIPQLMVTLEHVVGDNGEGLMLHHKQARYHVGRTDNIVKLKPYQDAEAKVIGHKKGQGKYKNMLGSLLVETERGVRFYIGTGFSDKERQQPPPIGSIITFKYFGLTAYGKPRFSSFVRVRLLSQ